ncbi:hypothetical protein SmJEL517_g02753 [Synchytrium microbalum]|uniref:Uncharacterized protein n=1 Tax=Synchytrium microbalum TaxID=1806994 RepID=A0A507C5Y1_9FUNG|nr:uncharacterized protein SmJEL517_g02753 [Synchytrium microbalum]TPX34758.1 hypothetical protein SmJEL517_g02753 [Synchytrium microbalum]
MDTLISYLPDDNLPRFIALVSAIAFGNCVQCFLTKDVVARIYSKQKGQVSPLMARMMGTWTLTSSVIRLYCAYNIREPALYKVTMISYVIALFSFLSESTVFNTAEVFSAPVILPFLFSSMYKLSVSKLRIELLN